MKNVFDRIGSAVVTIIGICFGKWLWDEILKGKAEDLKQKLSRKD